MSKEEVEKLLRHGAYDMFREEEEGNAEKESSEFIDQDIDTILERRSKTVVNENTGSNSNAAGGTFSKASFKALAASDTNDGDGASNKEIDIDDPDFWKKMVGEAKFEEKDVLQSGKKRSRNKAIYNEKLFDQGLIDTIGESDVDSTSGGSDEEFEQSDGVADELDEFDFSKEMKNDHLKRLMQRSRTELDRVERKRWGGKTVHQWMKEDVDLLVKLLLRYGYGNIPWDSFLTGFKSEASKSYDDIEVSCDIQMSIVFLRKISILYWHFIVSAGQTNVLVLVFRSARGICPRQRNRSSPSY